MWILPFGAFPIKSICCTIQGLNTLLHPYTHSNPTNIHTLHPNALRHLFQVSRDTSGQQQTPTDTKEHQQTLPDTQKGCSRICGGLCWHQMAFAEVWWCLMTSLTVLCCQQMLKGCLKNSSKGIWVLFMDLFKVWMRIRLYRSGQALYGVANALYWKSSERQNSHTWQFWNIKIPKPPYISSLKIIGFLHFLNFLGPSEKNYNPQSLMITLYNDEVIKDLKKYVGRNRHQRSTFFGGKKSSRKQRSEEKNTYTLKKENWPEKNMFQAARRMVCRLLRFDLLSIFHYSTP